MSLIGICASGTVGQCAGREVARVVSGGAGERVAVKLQYALQRRDSSNLA